MSCHVLYIQTEFLSNTTLFDIDVFILDVWSAGCVFAEMFTGTPLFPGESSVDQVIDYLY